MTSSEQQPRAPEADGDRPQDAKQHPPTNSTEALEAIARSICKAAGDNPDAPDRKGNACWTHYQDEATAALSHLRELQEENVRQGFLLALMAACAEERYVGKDRGQWIRYERLHERALAVQAGRLAELKDERERAAEALASTYREENERLRDLIAAFLKNIGPDGYSPDAGKPLTDAFRQALTTPRTETGQ